MKVILGAASSSLMAESRSCKVKVCVCVCGGGGGGVGAQVSAPTNAWPDSRSLIAQV